MGVEVVVAVIADTPPVQERAIFENCLRELVQRKQVLKDIYKTEVLQVKRRCIALKNNDLVLLNHGIHLPLISEY